MALYINKIVFILASLVLIFFAGIVYKRAVSLPKITDLASLRPKPVLGVTDSFVKKYFNVDRKPADIVRHFEPLSFPVQRNASFDYKDAMKRLNEEKVSSDDPRLIELIRNYFIVPPSTEPYALSEDRLDYSIGQAPIVDNTLKFMEGGFYVECGACDGEWGTNTLFFERARKWNGVLIEADPSNFKKLLSKHRKAFMLNACLSSNPYPSTIIFKPGFNVGKIVGTPSDKTLDEDTIEVQCFPLYSILLALNQLRVDFLSLDVEGVELEVLKNIPFDKVDIDMMAVEYNHIPEGEEGLKKFGRRAGYDPLFRFDQIYGRAMDIIFKKRNKE